MSKILAGLRTLGAGLAEAAGDAASAVGKKAGELASQGASAVGAEGLLDAAGNKALAIKRADREVRIHMISEIGRPITVVVRADGVVALHPDGHRAAGPHGAQVALKGGVTLIAKFDDETGNTEITIVDPATKSTVE